MEFIKKGLSKPTDWLLLGVVICLTVLVFYVRNIERLDNVTDTSATSNDAIRQAVNDVYKADTTAIRHLADVATALQAGGLKIPGNLGVTQDLNVMGKINSASLAPSQYVGTDANNNLISLPSVSSAASLISYAIWTGSNITTLAGQTFQNNSVSAQIDLSKSAESPDNVGIKNSSSTLINTSGKTVTCLVTFSGLADVNSGKGAQIKLRKNGVDLNYNSYVTNGSAGTIKFTLGGSDIVKLAPNDYIDFVYEFFDSNVSGNPNLQNFYASIVGLY